MAEIHQEKIVNPEVHHEDRDVPVKPIYWFVVIFLIFTGVSYVALGFLFEFFKKVEKGNQPAPVTMVRGAKPEIAPEPRLQPFGAYGQQGARGTPEADMKKMREEEDADLTSYGWVDRQKGIVRIPIAQAIDMTAQQNLPVRQIPVAAAPSTPPAPMQPAAAAQATVAPAAASNPGQARSSQK